MKTSTVTSRSLPNLPPNSRYELLFKLASGGMASVYVGRIRGAGGFWRLVAIKKAHAHLLEDPSFRRMLVEEARLASRIHHPNVVAVLDVEQAEDSLLLVMDYIEGASLADVMATKEPLPARLGVRIALDACAGLHAAHTLTDPSGKPLQIVHRDVSPQNLLVGVDGVSRVTDFGIAKSTQHASTTTTGALKGKLAYMAPEYVDGKAPDQRSDVFGLGVVIWEALANRRLFRGENEVDTLKRIVNADAPLLSSVAPHIGTHLDPVLSAALAKDPGERFATAKALGTALEIAAGRANLVGSAEEVGAFIQKLFTTPLSERRRFIQEHVASDVGPPSVRSTADGASQANTEPKAAPGGGPSQTDPNEVAHAQTNVASNVKSEAEKTRSLKGKIQTVEGEDDSSHPSSTLDGSGVSPPEHLTTVIGPAYPFQANCLGRWGSCCNRHRGRRGHRTCKAPSPAARIAGARRIKPGKATRTHSGCAREYRFPGKRGRSLPRRYACRRTVANSVGGRNGIRICICYNRTHAPNRPNKKDECSGDTFPTRRRLTQPVRCQIAAVAYPLEYRFSGLNRPKSRRKVTQRRRLPRDFIPF
ncbi:MAG: serine/threonine protein kinase [Polyangiaceae bacterium]|nr:serine/threonine protein kinase [Polyangiaceae bacterium]